jgi:hypothetical protein
MSAYIARTTQVAARALGGEMMIMSASDSTLFNLNEVATAIWRAADGATPLESIVENVICAQFDTTPEQAMQDAQQFVRDLAEHGILVVSDQPIPSPNAGRTNP